MEKKIKRRTVSEKRVEILKDAILQIKTRRYKVEKNNYCTLAPKSIVQIKDLAKSTPDPYAVQLNKHMDYIITPSKPCEVCAKGALVISAISKFNNYSLGHAAAYNGIHSVSSKSREIFGTSNANRMEAAFEGWASMDQNDTGQVPNYKIKKWKEKYPNIEDRLIAIFRNAIRNKGIFKP